MRLGPETGSRAFEMRPTGALCGRAVPRTAGSGPAVGSGPSLVAETCQSVMVSSGMSE